MQPLNVGFHNPTDLKSDEVLLDMKSADKMGRPTEEHISSDYISHGNIPFTFRV